MWRLPACLPLPGRSGAVSPSFSKIYVPLRGSRLLLRRGAGLTELPQKLLSSLVPLVGSAQEPFLLQGRARPSHAEAKCGLLWPSGWPRGGYGPCFSHDGRLAAPRLAMRPAVSPTRLHGPFSVRKRPPPLFCPQPGYHTRPPPPPSLPFA